MKDSISKTKRTVILFFTGIGLVPVFLCTLPQDPFKHLDDVTISIQYLDEDKADSITINDTLSLQVLVTYPELIDSMRIEVEDEIDTLFSDVKDTQNISIVVTHLGSTIISGIAYCRENRQTSDTDSVFIRSIPVAVQEEPQSETVNEGGVVTFRVEVSGNPEPSVQWFCDSVAVKDATGDSLSIDHVTSSLDGSTYRVRVANSVDTCWSDEAVLTVIRAASIWDRSVWDQFVWY